MLRNYFKTAWRSLVRGRSFSFINIAGLAIGMAGAVLILLWLTHEVSYDKFHQNKDRIYQLYVMTDIPGEKHQTAGNVSNPLGPTLQREFPEVEAYSRFIDVDDWLLTVGDKSFSRVQGAIVDSNFLKIFSFPLTAGAVGDQLHSLSSIVITEKLAMKLYNTTDVVGKTMVLDRGDQFKVSGVLKDLPGNTQFTFDYLLPYGYLKKFGWNDNDWMSNNTTTYTMLRPNTNLSEFNAKIRNLSRIKTGRKDLWLHFAYPLSQWHLYNEFDNGQPSGGRISLVQTFGCIAAFILLIACINFINLSTARSEQRAKEVGIRKVAGAARTLLIGQFIVEAILTACIAGGLALLVVQLVLPAFSVLVGTTLRVPYGQLSFWVCALGFILLTGVLAGGYPAFYLSSFKPVGIFRKQFRKTNAVFTPRRVLVVLQFTFAIVLIISTLVMREQLQYAADRNTGYSQNNLVYVIGKGDIEKNYAVIRQELLTSGTAVSVTGDIIPLDNNQYRGWGYRWAGERPRDTTTTIHIFTSDAGLVKTAGLKLVAGRDIDIYNYATDSSAVMLNETAAQLMGFKNPIGAEVNKPYSGKRYHVVGVVKDFIINSPYNKIPPMVIEGALSSNVLHIKLNPANSTAENLSRAARIFKQFNPGYPFEYQFVDQEYAAKFSNEQRTRTLSGVFAGLAIFISCLGLFGLSAFVAESRVKEIGVRKVLGASVAGIAQLLSIEFVGLVLISMLIAAPVAWYAMVHWLADYDYHIAMSWGVFVLAGVLAVAIAVVTVSFQAVRAATANPIKSLRTE